MGDHSIVEENGGDSMNPSSSRELDIYPLSCYYFGSIDSVSLKSETAADRLLRMKAKYASISTSVWISSNLNFFPLVYCLFLNLFSNFDALFAFWGFSYDAYGTRSCVAAVIVVSLSIIYDSNFWSVFSTGFSGILPQFMMNMIIGMLWSTFFNS